MDKDVYMHWPPGYEKILPKKEGTVIKLLKALYGLHQCEGTEVSTRTSLVLYTHCSSA